MSYEEIKRFRNLRPDRDWTVARTVHTTQPWPDAVPSTIAFAARGAWVLSGRLEVLFGGSTADTFTLRRYDAP